MSLRSAYKIILAYFNLVAFPCTLLGSYEVFVKSFDDGWWWWHNVDFGASSHAISCLTHPHAHVTRDLLTFTSRTTIETRTLRRRSIVVVCYLLVISLEGLKLSSLPQKYKFLSRIHVEAKCLAYSTGGGHLSKHTGTRECFNNWSSDERLPTAVCGSPV